MPPKKSFRKKRRSGKLFFFFFLEISTDDVSHGVVGEDGGHVHGVDVVGGLQLQKLAVALVQNLVQKKEVLEKKRNKKKMPEKI